MIPDISCRILDSLPLGSFVPAFLQAYTLCRYNELDQISMSFIINRSTFILRSSKSKNLRSIDPLPEFKRDQRRSIPFNTPIMVISYDLYKQNIKRVKSIHGIKLLDRKQDLTHIFRHIFASVYFSQGYPKKEISEKLGHSNNKTTDQYIRSIKIPGETISQKGV